MADERPFASRLRTAVFRAVLFAATLVVVHCLFNGIGALLVDFPDAHEVSFWIRSGLTGVVFGLVAAPLAFVEDFAARRARSRAGDWGAGCLMGLLALVGFLVAAVQVAYTWGIVNEGSPGAGVGEIGVCYRVIREEALVFIPLFDLVAVPFIATTVARLRRYELGRSVKLSAIGGTALSLPAMLWLFVSLRGGDRPVFPLICGLAVMLDAALPVVFYLADSIERRVSERLARSEAGS